MAAVIANVTDGIATWVECFWLLQTLLPLWQMYCLHRVNYYFFHFKCWDVKQNLISCEVDCFCLCFDKGWTIDSYVYSFFYECHEVLVLPPHCTEIFQCSGMTCSVKMVIHWEKGASDVPWISLQKTRNTNVLPRRQNHQRPPDVTQRQRFL